MTESYMVYIQGQAGPTFMHADRPSAEAEATRLLSLPGNRGRAAYLLQVVAIGTVKRQPVEWVENGGRDGEERTD